MVKKSTTDQVLVFLRRMVPGKVKSRLARDLGDDEALDVYRYLLWKTYEAINARDWSVNLFFDSESGPIGDWFDQFTSYVQNGDGLGDRMLNAFQSMAGVHTKKIMIGSDCPDISQEILKDAFLDLNDHDVVLGPALDGGIYLLGIKKLHPGLLSNVDWSTEHVCAQIIGNCKKQGLTYKLQVELFDVDHLEDYRLIENDYLFFKQEERNEAKRAS